MLWRGCSGGRGRPGQENENETRRRGGRAGAGGASFKWLGARAGAGPISGRSQGTDPASQQAAGLPCCRERGLWLASRPISAFTPGPEQSIAVVCTSWPREPSQVQQRSTGHKATNPGEGGEAFPRWGRTAEIGTMTGTRARPNFGQGELLLGCQRQQRRNASVPFAFASSHRCSWLHLHLHVASAEVPCRSCTARHLRRALFSPSTHPATPGK